MSEYSSFILVNRNTLGHTFLLDVTECRKLMCRIAQVPLYSVMFVLVADLNRGNS